jgi:hypothetical protein
MDRLNQWLTLLANIAVLVGIIFVAWEIQQNTEATHAQTREAVMSAAQFELQSVRVDPNLIHSIVCDCALSEDEQIKLYTWLTSVMKIREFSWLQRRSGIIDDDQWASEFAVTRAITQAPRVRLWWARVGRHTVGEAYRGFVDQLIADVPASNGIYEAQMRWADETN